MSDLKPGVYHGQRPVRGVGRPWNHEYIMVVPKNKKGLSKDARSKLKKIGNTEALVAGAYGTSMTAKNRKLKAKLGDRVDVAAARSGKGLKRLSSSNPTKSANRVAKRSREFKPRDYPNVIQNILGAKDNSNTYARALLKDLKHKKGHGRSIRNPGAGREMKLEALDNLLEFSEAQRRKNVEWIAREHERRGRKTRNIGYLASIGALGASFIPAIRKRKLPRKLLRGTSAASALAGYGGEGQIHVGEGYKSAAKGKYTSGSPSAYQSGRRYIRQK